MRDAGFSAWAGVAIVLVMLAGLRTPANAANGVPQLDDLQRAAAFRAAGAIQRGGRWLLCPSNSDDEGDASIGDVADLDNGERLAVIVSGPSASCFGNSGSGFRVLERDGAGQWKTVYSGAGSARFTPAPDANGHVEMMLLPDDGGCGATLRWDGNSWIPASSAAVASVATEMRMPGTCSPPT